MTIQRRTRKLSFSLHRVCSVIVFMVVGCGGSTTETPADLGGRDAGAPDAADSSSDMGIPESGPGDGEASADAAPRPLAFDQCRSKADCTDPGVVNCEPPPPDRLVGAGPCSGGPACTSDSECQADGGGEICDVPPVPCTPNTKVCMIECVDTETCEAGEVCTGHRCVALPCQNDAQCPVDSACAAGSCARKTCTTDDPCSGYCVRGKCYSAPGWCLNHLPP